MPPSWPRPVRGAPVRWSATLGAETEVKETLPSPDLRMLGSGYIVLEVHGADGRVVYAQEPRPGRQNRHSCCTSRAKRDRREVHVVNPYVKIEDAPLLDPR